jgi:hypothetical protein
MIYHTDTAGTARDWQLVGNATVKWIIGRGSMVTPIKDTDSKTYARCPPQHSRTLLSLMTRYFFIIFFVKC